ncbi:DUF6338 family protein [Clostridium sp. ZS1]|uniref:DUF6338 family protein n=1 Tax=Clostridium sp. ZS1 TaxID=2949989 RepID=UPI002079BAD6|nr:DUF6338 family protein [Clostridium sp. ZS1]
MKISEIINSIPILFTYFIPGYISLYIKENYLHEKCRKETHLFLLSIILSFVIRSSIESILYIVNLLLKYNISLEDNIKSCIYILVAVLVGVVMILYKDSKIESKINKILKNNVISEPIVWNHALKCVKGGFARVYLYDQDLMYIGNLINYTVDPEDDRREVLLTAFSSYKLSDKTQIEDNSKNDNATVLIECKDIKNIEIFKA